MVRSLATTFVRRADVAAEAAFALAVILLALAAVNARASEPSSYTQDAPAIHHDDPGRPEQPGD